jgi:hypothetical protein
MKRMRKVTRVALRPPIEGRTGFAKNVLPSFPMLNCRVILAETYLIGPE